MPNKKKKLTLRQFLKIIESLPKESSDIINCHGIECECCPFDEIENCGDFATDDVEDAIKIVEGLIESEKKLKFLEKL